MRCSPSAHVGSLLATALAIVFCPIASRASQSATLIWASNTNPDIAGYIVYYGAASRTYTNAIDVGTTTTTSVTGLVDNVTYFFEVTAYNSSHVESDFSAETSFTPGATPPPPPPSPTPVVATMAASSVTTNSATLNAFINPNGYPAVAWFDCGTTTSYGTRTPAVSVGNGSTPISVQNSISYLPGTVCHFRAVATNYAGMSVGTDSTFTAPSLVPAITTESATSLTSSSADLNALVNPNGGTTVVFFEYGTGTNYGTFSQGIAVGTGNSDLQTKTSIAGLTPGKTYHYRTCGTNCAGIAYGSDLVLTTLTTDVAPAVTTLAASQVASTSAVLNGTANPNGGATLVWFQYGLDTSYATTTWPVNVGSGTALLNANASLANLVPGSTYHFRVCASNAVAVVYGGDQTFATTAVGPTVITKAATGVAWKGATFNGIVTPNGAATTAYFEYGTTTSYGTKTPAVNVGSGISQVPVSTTVSTLLPGTTYHVRLVASNAAGQIAGADSTFITSIRRNKR